MFTDNYQLIEQLCRGGCAACSRVCPASAIKVVGPRVFMDDEKCPRGALVLR